MSSISMQRAALNQLALRLNPTNLKRALGGLRQSEAEHFMDMLRDAAATLATVPEPKQPPKEHTW